jgi:hypothetical protein
MHFLGFVIKLETDAVPVPELHCVQSGRKTGKLENWKTGKLENWKTGNLRN